MDAKPHGRDEPGDSARAFREHFQVPRNARPIGDRITHLAAFIDHFLEECYEQASMAPRRRQSHEQPAPIRRAASLPGLTPLHPDPGSHRRLFASSRGDALRHNLSASGAVRHLLRDRFGLPHLPAFDPQPMFTVHPDPTHG
ncbi:MAG: hypothetical protein QE276_13900 [Cyanobium sp. D14.bin.5]|nr:hypothetical protein [Cyanobium sp. D14.bin.5]